MNTLRTTTISGNLVISSAMYTKGNIYYIGSGITNTAIMQSKTATNYYLNCGGGPVYFANSSIYVTGSSFYYHGYQAVSSGNTSMLSMNTSAYGTPLTSTILYGLAFEASSPTNSRTYITDTIRLPIRNTNFYYSGNNRLYHTVPAGYASGTVKPIVSTSKPVRTDEAGNITTVASGGASAGVYVTIPSLKQATYLTFFAKANATGSHYISVDDRPGSTIDPAGSTDTIRRIYATGTYASYDIMGGGIIIPQNETYYVHFSQVQWYFVKRAKLGNTDDPI